MKDTTPEVIWTEEQELSGDGTAAEALKMLAVGVRTEWIEGVTPTGVW
ncbi:hypothetical protein [Kineosporia succinea]|uniref:Uncharacterized protein n=1 Tax=Kineosporia succinea TaxID=84632 RepID=A0ABT9P9N0_9ACTN|nr:hypothetical protein [Kineosporia succinea]MDP9829408.1 hypothetical protein [Kineosporia succinea]